jgi:hypothetical protein
MDPLKILPVRKPEPSVAPESHVLEHKTEGAKQHVLGSSPTSPSTVVPVRPKGRENLSKFSVFRTVFQKILETVSSFPSYVRRKVEDVRIYLRRSTARIPPEEISQQIAAKKEEFFALQGMKEQIAFVKVFCQRPSSLQTKELAAIFGTAFAENVTESAKKSATTGVAQYIECMKALNQVEETDFTRGIKSSLISGVMEAPLKAMEEDPISPYTVRLAECAQQVIALSKSDVPRETMEWAGRCVDRVCASSFSIEHTAVVGELGGVVADVRDLDEEGRQWAARSPTSHLVQDTYGRAASIEIGGKLFKEEGKGQVARAFGMVKALEEFCKKNAKFPPSMVPQVVDQLMWRSVIGNLSGVLFNVMSVSLLGLERMFPDAPEFLKNEPNYSFQIIDGTPPQLQVKAVRFMKNVEVKMDSLEQVPRNVIKMTSTITIPALLPIPDTWREDVVTEVLPLDFLSEKI